MVRQRIVVGLADDLQVVVRPVGAHLLQQVTELGDREDVGRDLVAKRRHSAIIRRICRTSDRFYTLCVSFGSAENQRPSQAKLQPQPREAMSQGTALVLEPALRERMRVESVPPQAQKIVNLDRSAKKPAAAGD